MLEHHLSHLEQNLGILQVSMTVFICPEAVLSKEEHLLDNMAQLLVISDFILNISLNYLNMINL